MIRPSAEEKFIYEELCQYVGTQSSHSAANAFTPQPIGNRENLDVLWKEADEYYSISYYRHISSNYRVIGKGIVFVKRVVRKLLKWLIAPICENQSYFNGLITHLSGATVNELRQLSQALVCNETQVELLKEQVQLLRTECTENQVMTQLLQTECTENQEMTQLLQAECTENQEMIQLLRAECATNQEYILQQQEENRAELLSLYEKIQLSSKGHERLQTALDQTKDEITAHIKQHHLNDSTMDKNSLAYQAAVTEVVNIIPSDCISFAQAGEDRIISNILFSSGIYGFESTYLDVGANHALSLSNTYFFYRQGARGVLVEANPKLAIELKALRPEDIVINQCVSAEAEGKVDFFVMSGDGLSTTNPKMAQKYVGGVGQFEIAETIQVETISINQIIAQYFKKTPCVLSIDVEDDTFPVLKSLDLDCYRPFVIVVETHVAGTQFLQKDMQIVSYMQTNQYEEVAFTGINSIFIDQKNKKDGSF